jgi:hypothetical protein
MIRKFIATILIVSVCLMGSGCKRKVVRERAKKAIAAITQEQVENVVRLMGVPDPVIQGVKFIKGTFF